MRSCPKRAYIRACFCTVPAFVAENGRGSCRHPSLCSGSRSPGCDTSFELPFIAWVAFRLNFMAGINLHFIFTFIRLNISKLKIVESFSNKGGVLFVSRNHALHAIAKAQQDVSNVKGKIITQAFANKIPLCREIPEAIQR